MLTGTNHKIKVGFIINASNEWIGGINYFKNLFLAIKLYESSKLQPVLVLNDNIDNTLLLKNYSNLAKIIKSKILFSKSNKLSKLSKKLLGSTVNSFLYDFYFKLRNVNIMSHIIEYPKHSDLYYVLKKIGWIADFQHIHLPEMFSPEEIKYRNRIFSILAKQSNIIILSSIDAKKDYENFAPEYAHKARVLHFVSIQNHEIYEEKPGQKEKILNKYGLKPKFFYVPNQFWKHKNHKVVFEAVNILKKHNLDVQIVFTGQLNDNRNKDYIIELQDYVKNNNLEDNLRILGLVDYVEVPFFIRNCVSLINPSLFEGWNTMVEEAKSIGKNIILSNLAVHREQNPLECVYFDPYNPEELAEILREKWQNSEGGPDYELEEQARIHLKGRVENFAKTYEEIVLESLRN